MNFKLLRKVKTIIYTKYTKLHIFIANVFYTLLFKSLLAPNILATRSLNKSQIQVCKSLMFLCQYNA